MEKNKPTWDPSPNDFLVNLRQAAEVSLEYWSIRPITHRKHIEAAKKGTGINDAEQALHQIYVEERMADILQDYICKTSSPQELVNLMHVISEWAPTTTDHVQSYHRGTSMAAFTKILLPTCGWFATQEPESLTKLGEAWKTFAPTSGLIPKTLREESIKYVSSTFEQPRYQELSYGVMQVLSELTDQSVIQPQFWLNTLKSLGQHVSIDFLKVAGERLILDKPIQRSKAQPGALSLSAGKVVCFALERAALNSNRNTAYAQKILDFISFDSGSNTPLFSFDKVVAIANVIIDQKNAQPTSQKLDRLPNAISSYPMAFALLMETTRSNRDTQQAHDDEICITIVSELLALSSKQGELIPRTMGELALVFPEATNEELIKLLKEDPTTSRSRTARLYRIARAQANREKQINWRTKTKSRGGLLT